MLVGQGGNWKAAGSVPRAKGSLVSEGSSRRITRKEKNDEAGKKPWLVLRSKNGNNELLFLLIPLCIHNNN